MTDAPRLRLQLPTRDALTLRPGQAVVVEGDPAPVLRALLGPRGGGTAWLDGTRLRGGIATRVAAGLGVVRDVPVAPEVTVRDHLAAAAGPGVADDLLRGAPLLDRRGGDRAGVLSGGERVVLAWLRALATGPRAVLLDRAGAGLDAPTLAWAARTVAQLRSDGCAVVLVPGREEERRWLDDAIALHLAG